MITRGVSLWFDQLPELTPRPALATSLSCDVAIVGSGFTGLWTAYYLLRRDPTLRIVVLDARFAGFGASGRNGGWCSALFPVSATALAGEHGVAAATAQYAAMRGAVGEVIDVCAREGLAADLAHGGTIVLARSHTQLQRARETVRESAEFDLGTALLDTAAAQSRLAASDVVGATYTPHCAALQPAKLVRELAGLVAQRGATIFENTPVVGIEPGRVHTASGLRVDADVIVRATEGYTARLAGHTRDLVPVYSLIVATEPLPEQTWARIGLRQRETFSDYRHLIIYGQRTADDRLVFGGRGAPYHFGSRIEPAYDRDPRVFALLEHTVRELFPQLGPVRFTHRWGGPLGIARDWHASCGLDRTTGMGWAGGYVGDGVATTNLAGRTLADLITATPSELTGLPWVDHRSPRWEPEPLRWLGANAGLRAMTWADDAEARHGKPSRVADLVNAMMGR